LAPLAKIIFGFFTDAHNEALTVAVTTVAEGAAKISSYPAICHGWDALKTFSKSKR
jgi:hypothetical protein